MTTLLGVIPETNVVKSHLALEIFDGGGMIHLLILLFLSQEFKHPLGGRRHGLQHVGNLRKLGDGMGKVAHILNKRLNIADRNGFRRPR